MNLSASSKLNNPGAAEYNSSVRLDPAPTLRRLHALLAALLGLAVLVACAPEPAEETHEIEVTGEFGRRPQVAFDAPLEIRAPSTDVLIEGEGKTLEEDRSEERRGGKER